MRVNAFFLADHAEAVNGKLYVTGGCWDRILAAQLPAQHAHLSVVFAVQVPWTATNEKHALELGLVDADGQSALPNKVGGEFEVGRPPGWRPGDDAMLVGVFNLNGLPLAKAGTYNFVLSIDGTEVAKARLSVQVVQVPSMSG